MHLHTGTCFEYGPDPSTTDFTLFAHPHFWWNLLLPKDQEEQEMKKRLSHVGCDSLFLNR
jgi:hypothetical protein